MVRECILGHSFAYVPFMPHLTTLQLPNYFVCFPQVSSCTRLRVFGSHLPPILCAVSDYPAHCFCLSGSSLLSWGIHHSTHCHPWIPALIVSLPLFFWSASAPFSGRLLQERSRIQPPLPSLCLRHLVLRRRIRPRFCPALVNRAVRYLPSL